MVGSGIPPIIGSLSANKEKYYEGWRENKVSSVNWAQFGLIDVVQHEFAFLKSYGFRCVLAEPLHVRFESTRVFINIYYILYEIDLDIGLMGTEETYTLSPFINFIDQAKAVASRNFIALTPLSLQHGIQLLRKEFEQYCMGALSGDPEFFIKLKNQGDQLAASFSQELHASQTRPKAASAFHEKNYKEAARLYESMRTELTPAELKKLEYAIQHSCG